MNKYKALVRYEAKALIGMAVYFFGVCLVALYSMYSVLKNQYISFLRMGLRDYMYSNFHIFEALSNASNAIILGGLIGIAIMVFAQFRDTKSVEVGRFMKALPIQNKKVYSIKVICGVVTYTIPYILFSISVLIVRAKFSGFVEETFAFTNGAEFQQIVDSVGYISLVLLINYLILTFSYLLLMLMQYLISQPVVSIVLSGIIGCVPIYILTGIALILYEYIDAELVDKVMSERSIGYAFPWLYTLDTSNYNISSGQVEGMSGSLYYITQIELRTVILIVLCAVALVVGYMASKHFNVEHADELVSMPIMRKILVIGITVCSALIPLYAKAMFWDMEKVNGLVMSLAMIIVGIIGFLISKKVVNIGTGVERR